MNRKCWYQRILIMVFVIGVIFTSYYSYHYFLSDIPDSITVELNSSPTIQLSKREKVKIETSKVGHYQITCKSLGFWKGKVVDVNVVEKTKVYVGGFPIGIYLQTEGVMVIGTGVVSAKDGLNYEPALGKIKSDDYITSLNQIPVCSKSQLIFLVQKYGSQEIVLGIRRENAELEVKIDPVLTEEGEYKLGVWVRDDTQGIGTVTYITDNGSYGALGHGISDIDTGNLLNSKNGNLYQTEIWGIKRGENGNPGGLCGNIEYEEERILGTIEENSNQGIFGTSNGKLQQECQLEKMEVAYKQEIKEGKAYIRSMVNGTLKDYEIEILKVNVSEKQINKGLVIQVKDPELLQLTNGIVQGMSGSPIIQGGKLIGAVTHVFVNDSTKGYGIFIENMLKH